MLSVMKNGLSLIALSFVMFFHAQNNFVITDVRVFDGERVIEKTSVRVTNGIITEIATALELPSDYEVIDGSGKTLIPALSNAHVHAWSPQSLQEAAQSGILNVMDMHGVEPYQVMMKRLKDSTDYARYFVAGYAATAPEGHGTQFGFPVPTLSSSEDAKSFIEGRVKASVDYIKIIVEPWRKTLSAETVKAVIDEAHKADKIAVVHVSRLEDAQSVLSSNADGLVHIWWDKPMDEQELNELRKVKDFFVIPTLLTTFKAFDTMGEDAQKYMDKLQLLEEVKKLHDAGVPILAGTDPPNLGINYGKDLYEELKLFAEAGLSTTEVLKSATSNISRAFGLENTGYIRPDYFADMVLVEGDVISDINTIANMTHIWKKGKSVNQTDN